MGQNVVFFFNGTIHTRIQLLNTGTLDKLLKKFLNVFNFYLDKFNNALKLLVNITTLPSHFI